MAKNQSSMLYAAQKIPQLVLPCSYVLEYGNARWCSPRCLWRPNREDLPKHRSKRRKQAHAILTANPEWDLSNRSRSSNEPPGLACVKPSSHPLGPSRLKTRGSFCRGNRQYPGNAGAGRVVSSPTSRHLATQSRLSRPLSAALHAGSLYDATDRVRKSNVEDVWDSSVRTVLLVYHACDGSRISWRDVVTVKSLLFLTIIMPSLFDIVSSNDVAHYAVPFGVGVLAHVCLFRVGEWDLRTTQLLVTFLAAQGLLGLYVWKSGQADGVSLFAAWKAAAGFSFIFLSGVFSSILTYRAAFHRLNRFPGPFAARLSNFYVTCLSIKKFQLFQEIRELHEQYGDIVRVGMGGL